MALSKLDQKVFPFFRAANMAGVSDVFSNFNYDLLTIEVSGSAMSVQATIQGCINTVGPNKEPIDNANLEWSDLAVINTADYSVSEKINSKGIFSIGISGLSKIRVVLNNISGGVVNIIGVLEA